MAELSVDLSGLLDHLEEMTKTTLATVPPVEVADGDITGDSIPSAAAQKWLKIPDVVVVVCDLKGSTKLGTGKHDTSTARIYKSAVEGAVRVLHDFGADFIDIQGDGGFGVYWGDRRFERALCAGVTVKTFSDAWYDQLKSKDASVPETGYKVGIASGRVLVKYLGTRNPADDEQEPVWAGKPVNYAAKCAQAADAGQIIVTSKVWSKFESNDYVTHSCGCNSNGVLKELWEHIEVDSLPEDATDAAMLKVGWCASCGPGFCASILNGDSHRAAVTESLRQSSKEVMRMALERKNSQRVSYPR